jgi:hypothetical protein
MVKIEYLLLFLIAIFLFYSLSNCGCGDGFSVGAPINCESITNPAKCHRHLRHGCVLKDGKCVNKNAQSCNNNQDCNCSNLMEIVFDNYVTKNNISTREPGSNPAYPNMGPHPNMFDCVSSIVNDKYEKKDVLQHCNNDDLVNWCESYPYNTEKIKCVQKDGHGADLIRKPRGIPCTSASECCRDTCSEVPVLSKNSQQFFCY